MEFRGTLDEIFIGAERFVDIVLGKIDRGGYGAQNAAPPRAGMVPCMATSSREGGHRARAGRGKAEVPGIRARVAPRRVAAEDGQAVPAKGSGGGLGGGDSRRDGGYR